MVWMLLLSEALAGFEPGTVGKCSATPGDLTESTESAFAQTVMIETMSGTGSGVLVSPDGAILSAAHVVGTASEVTVSFADGSTRPARVLRVDPASDAALLQVDADVHLPCVSMFVPAEARPGATVFALGYPLRSAGGPVTTKGVWSTTVEADGRSYIQTDAALNAGNSGGPLFLDDGRLAGTVVAKLVGVEVEGVAFALDVASAARALALDEGSTTTTTGPARVEPVFDPIALISVMPSASMVLPKFKEKRDCRAVSQDPFEPKLIATAAGGRVTDGATTLLYFHGGEITLQLDTKASTLAYPANGPTQAALEPLRGTLPGAVFLELLTADGSRLRLPAIDARLEQGLIVWALDEAGLEALAAAEIQSSRVLIGETQTFSYGVPDETTDTIHAAAACFVAKLRG